MEMNEVKRINTLKVIKHFKSPRGIFSSTAAGTEPLSLNKLRPRGAWSAREAFDIEL